MAKRRSWAGLVMVLILLAVLAAWWWPGGRLAPFDDSDLRPVQASLAEDDNAWPALLAAAEHLRWPAELGKRSGHFAAPDTWEADRVAELLAENQEAWRWLETALARERIQVPAPQAFVSLGPAGHGDWIQTVVQHRAISRTAGGFDARGGCGCGSAARL